MHSLPDSRSEPYVHSILEFEREIETPAAIRNRINSYLFASSILYETLMLIRTMTKPFKDDDKFNNGLRLLLKNKAATAFEQQNLNPLRNGAVFHFLPDHFRNAINKTKVKECLFSSGHGDKKKDTTYPFADIIAAEILVGIASNTDEFYAALAKAMDNTKSFVSSFVNEAEELIGNYAYHWGFELVGYGDKTIKKKVSS